MCACVYMCTSVWGCTRLSVNIKARTLVNTGWLPIYLFIYLLIFIYFITVSHPTTAIQAG